MYSPSDSSALLEVGPLQECRKYGARHASGFFWGDYLRRHEESTTVAKLG